MANRYTPLPNPGSDENARRREMEAAFDYTDDGDDHHSELQPLNPRSSSPSSSLVIHNDRSPRSHGTYDFESLEYDHPPPGSPPQSSSVAVLNEIGNSNGILPTSQDLPLPRGPRPTWLRRAGAAILPAQLAHSIGIVNARLSGPVGGGSSNDGVFSNVTAKPTAPVRIQDGDETYMVPEDARAVAPPSYASAQADAVPPYWETTVHAPFSPDAAGELIIDSLPTGSIFSFCWNMLVSVSFQFIGFLITYLLHSSHAARLGSRAGLGVTLVQFGFALRARLDETVVPEGEGYTWNKWPSESAAPTPTGGITSITEAWRASVVNGTGSPFDAISEEEANAVVSSATTEWLSFFLMAIGWFILLSSLLGFWRVKRWERGILDANATPDSGHVLNALAQLESNFGLRGMSRRDLFRNGFGFGRQDPTPEEAVLRAEEGQNHPSITPRDGEDPELSAEASLQDIEMRLRQALRTAGLA